MREQTLGEPLRRGASYLSLTGDVMNEDAVAAPREPRYTPTWLVPQTVEGIGSSLADTVRRVTRCPAAVIVRDPATETASIVAVSVGVDRRLLGSVVAPGSAVGRACVGDVTAYGMGVGLLGCERRDRRQREVRGVAFSLIDGSRGVGAIVVFAPPELVDRRMNDYLVSLAKQAGRVIGRALCAQVTEQRGLIDGITGQANREGLERALGHMIGIECSLVCADIDQLAEVDPGMVNAVLRQVAAIFRNSLRNYDVPARIEGEGFALFLPDTVLEGAVKVADRVRVAVSESQFDLGWEHTFTCSLGVASVPDTVSDVNDLLAAAEAALEKAKSGGHNRAVAG